MVAIIIVKARMAERKVDWKCRPATAGYKLRLGHTTCN